MKKKLLAGALFVGSALLGACGGGYYTTGYYVRTAPPAPRYVGVVGVAPGPGYVWTNGYWGYSGGGYHWVDGRWARPPRARAIWVAPEWRHDGHGYRFHEGHWR